MHGAIPPPCGGGVRGKKWSGSAGDDVSGVRPLGSLPQGMRRVSRRHIREAYMNGKTFFIDQTRCTACRGCQAACKQWKKFGSIETRNTGSYQNPPDLGPSTFKLVRFNEVEVDGKLKWLFFPEQCRHCLEPPCKMVADALIPGAIVQDAETGAVLYTEKTKGLDYMEVRSACPYDIPRQDPATGLLTKCNMCIDRVQNGMLPACVKTCPTGTMHFGDRADMLELAQKRLGEVKKRSPAALLADSDLVRVLYLCELAPANYHSHMVAEADTSRIGPFSRRALLRLRPFA